METIAHNVKRLPCGCSLQKFPAVVAQLQGILKRFMDTLGCMDQCFLSDATLEQLPAPSQLGKTKVGGIDFNRPRIRWVVKAVLSLASYLWRLFPVAFPHLNWRGKSALWGNKANLSMVPAMPPTT